MINKTTKNILVLGFVKNYMVEMFASMGKNELYYTFATTKVFVSEEWASDIDESYFVTLLQFVLQQHILENSQPFASCLIRSCAYSGPCSIFIRHPRAIDKDF